MATALTHHGVECRLIEKTPAPNDKSKALVVWCRTLELLDGIGLASEFVQTGLKLSGGSIYANGERVVHLNLLSDESRYGFPLMIPQNLTEKLLTEHLGSKGIPIERQVELVTFQENAESVLCTLQHLDSRMEQVETPYLIGCDGAHSIVRHTLGLEFTGHAEPNDWMLADVHVEGPIAKDEVSIFWHEHGVLAFFPIDQNRFRVMSDAGPASDHVLPTELTLSHMQTLVDEKGPSGVTLSNQIWLSYFRINERKVTDYRKGRAILAGDAAHIHSPAGGQGMNTGMQDAFNLAWKLNLILKGQGRAEPLLESYSIERGNVGDLVLKNAERFTTLATLRSPIAQWLRNHIAPILGSFQAVQERIRDNWFELSINYRHSPLSGCSRSVPIAALLAGNRLCDTQVVSTSDGHQTNLFTVISSTQHTLLLLPVSKSSETILQLQKISADLVEAFPDVFKTHIVAEEGHETPIGPQVIPTWIDVDSQLHKKLNATSPTIVVVRPDAYIGYICLADDYQDLIEHLSCYLAQKSLLMINPAYIRHAV